MASVEFWKGFWLFEIPWIVTLWFVISIGLAAEMNIYRRMCARFLLVKFLHEDLHG